NFHVALSNSLARSLRKWRLRPLIWRKEGPWKIVLRIVLPHCSTKKNSSPGYAPKFPCGDADSDHAAAQEPKAMWLGRQDETKNRSLHAIRVLHCQELCWR